jgi:hypothetical protein
LLFVLLACSFGTALAHMGIDTSEFQARRQSVMSAASHGIALLHSFSGPKSWSDSGFRQDSNFYYFTGLENLHDAILAVDQGLYQEDVSLITPDGHQLINPPLPYLAADIEKLMAQLKRSHKSEPPAT